MSRERRIRVAPDVDLDVRESGRRGHPVVVLLHGFPESAHSWRHQMAPLADAGFHVLAPHQRGYAGSSAPRSVEAYRVDHLTADVCALLDDVGADRAVVVGHDWGAIVAWHMGMLHPERCRAIVGASVPYHRWPAPPTQVFRAVHGDRFFYIRYFQEIGVAEAELDADPERFLLSIVWVAAGETAGATLASELPFEGTTLVRAFEHRLGHRPAGPPPWLPRADFDVFVDQFRRSGFFGPVSWYRNFDANHELTKHIGPETFTMPTAFIAGADDPVISGRPEAVDAMAAVLPNHLASHLLPGVGHWVQQEAPGTFTESLLALLDRL
jgi:pimeloyl-ACP methyl ester carboxylesterase